MKTKADRFLENLKNKKIAVVGIGVSNAPVCKMLKDLGANVLACDKKSVSELGEFGKILVENDIPLKSGDDYMDNLDVDVIIRAPGLYYHNEKLENYRKSGIAVTSEMELFFELCPCKIYAITGTDGKTTTTTIVTEMLKKSGKKVYKGGNIGTALLPLVFEMTADDVAVVELSSFQLISMRQSPDVAAITNIYPDHLNVHSDMNEYIGAKLNLLHHQNAFSKAVLNLDNDETNKMGDLVRGELLKFSTKSVPKKGSFLDNDGWLCFTDGVNIEKIVHKDEIKIPGMHNVENYLTAISIVHGDVDNSHIADVAREFGGVEHRIEFVRELDNVRYYNDSIATSPASVTAGLRSFGRKIIIIAGGSDKQLDYSTLSGAINEYVKVLVLMGDTADKIESAVKSDKAYDEKNIKILRANTMEQAVEIARINASCGDVVSLSPASASFDKYRNFEERGKHFKSIVLGL